MSNPESTSALCVIPPLGGKAGSFGQRHARVQQPQLLRLAPYLHRDRRALSDVEVRVDLLDRVEAEDDVGNAGVEGGEADGERRQGGALPSDR